MTYSTSAPYNLLSVAKPNGTASPSVWNYVYTGTNLEEIYDPDAGVTAPASFNSGAPHSETIAYSSGMVSSLTDGTGASTTYTYADACSTGQCVGTNDAQTTTVKYPAEVPCSGCTAQQPQETDQYTSGLETSTTLGSTSNGDESETWGYTWNVGNGAANTSEVITYPSTLNVFNNASWVPPSATIIWDPAGNIVSTTNALGDSATSAYNDQGANNLPELLWSFPGNSSNAPSSPPTGSSIYTYNSYGQEVTATDPVGSTTDYGYYGPYSLLCYAALPSVSATLGSSPPSCTGATTDANTDVDVDAGASGAPVGSTTYSYDVQGDVVSSTEDVGDTSPGADPQTTTAAFDAMGNEKWTIPPAGQGGTQGPTNAYATSTTYSPANLPVTVTAPNGLTTSYAYDLAFNTFTTTTPSTVVTVLYDSDNRPCYQVVASSQQSLGPSCPTPASGAGVKTTVLAGSTLTTYVPGSLAVASATNGDGYTTWDYYGDLADPMSPTEVLDSLTTQPAYTSYDDYGNACVTGPSATTFTAAQCTAPSGDTATTHDALGNQTSVTDQTTGNVIDYYYENSSFPTLMTRRVISPSTGTETTRYSFDPDGRLLTTTNPDGTAVTLAYNVNGEVCSQQPTALVFPCGEGPAVAGVSEYVYNDAGERTSMTDNVGAPGATQWAQTTNYTYTTGELTSTTNANSQTISYLYSYAGQVVCVAYPVSSSTSCGTVSSPTTGSTTNTIVTRSYDSSGRLSSVKDWLGNTTSYTYADPWTPTTPTKITYPSSTGLTANYGYDNNDNATSLSVGTSITDAWTYNDDNEVATSKTNSSTSSAVAYNANKRITGAANLAQSTSNDIYTIASNGEITSDAPPSGSATDFSYNTADELCNTNTASILCTTNPTTGSKFASTANGQRGSATPYSSGTPGSSTYYDWNSYGQLCNVSSGSSTSCTSTPSTGTSYAYNGDGLRMTATTTSSGTVTSTTNSAWDSVTGGSIPLNIDDATTTSSGTTNASYVYGDLLFGGTAPVEQITTTSGGATAAFIVANQTGVQGVYGSTGTSLEQALYSAYGKATITGGAVTPFGFQGSYTDSTGLIYLVNRYYDPTTDEFLSIDPEVATTDQPYVFTNDDPLNAEDPLGDCWGWCTFTDAAHAVTSAASWVGRHPLETFGIVLGVAAAATGVGALGFGLIAATAAGEAATAATGTALSLGFAASLTGAGATALDGDSCVHGNKGACVGAYLGGVGFLTGGFATGGVLFEAGSLPSAISLGLGGVSASFGVASLLFDGVRVVTTSTASKLEKENLKKF